MFIYCTTKCHKGDSSWYRLWRLDKKQKKQQYIPSVKLIINAFNRMHCNNRNKSWKSWKHPERISKIKTFIDKCNSKRIPYPSKKRWLEEIEQNNLKIVFKVLSIKHKATYPAYVSKQNSKCEKQVI